MTTRKARRSMVWLVGLLLVGVVSGAGAAGPRIELVVVAPTGETTLVNAEEGQQTQMTLKGGPTFGLVTTIANAERSVVRVVVSELRGTELQDVGQLDVQVGAAPVAAPTSPVIRVGVRAIS